MTAQSEEFESRLRRRQEDLWPQTLTPVTPLSWMDTISATDESLQDLASLANSLDGSTAHLVALGSTSWIAEAFTDLGIHIGNGNGRRIEVVLDAHPNRLAAIDTTDADFVIISPNPADQATEAVFDLLLSRVKQNNRYVIIADPSSYVYARAQELGIRRLIATAGRTREPWRALGPEGLITPALLGNNLHDILEGARAGLANTNPTPKVDEFVESAFYDYDIGVSSIGLERWFDALLSTSGVDPHLQRPRSIPTSTPKSTGIAHDSKAALHRYGSTIACAQLTVALVGAVHSLNPFDPTVELEYDTALRTNLQREPSNLTQHFEVEDLFERISSHEAPERDVRIVEFTNHTLKAAHDPQQGPPSDRTRPLFSSSLHGPSALRSFGQIWVESNTPLHFFVLSDGSPMENITLRSYPYTFQELYSATAQLLIESLESASHSVYSTRV